MKIHFSFSKLLDNNRFVKIFSIFIAVIGWFIVAITIDPNATAIVQKVPVNFDLVGTVPESYGLSLTNGVDQTVDVKVNGKRYKIGNLDSEDLVAVPILTTVTKPGEYTLTVEVRKVNPNDGDYVVVSYSSTIKATFDFIAEETKDIIAVAENVKAAEGFVKEAVSAGPETITLKGPKAELDKIAKVTVENNIDQVVDDTLIVDGKLFFYDKDNNKIKLNDVTYVEQKFEITVSVFKHKVVPIKVTFVNVPQGLDTSMLDYTLSQESIEIAGPKATIDTIDVINVGEIDFRKVSIDSVFDLDVVLATGIVNVNSINKITVSINSTNLNTKQLSITNIISKNVPATFKIDVKTTVINNIRLVGRKADIDSITAKDLIAVIDFQNVSLSGGTSRVPVSIYTTGNKFVWAVGEYTVVVRAVKK